MVVGAGGAGGAPHLREGPSASPPPQAAGAAGPERRRRERRAPGLRVRVADPVRGGRAGLPDIAARAARLV